MSYPQVFVVVVVLIPLLLVALDRLRVDVAALLIAALLGAAQFLGMGVLGPANHPAAAVVAISGFSQPVVVTLLSLFIITQSLDASGITYWIAGRVIAFGGRSETRLIILFATTTALLSLFMNNLAAGALMLPSAISVARRTGITASKLLIPVAYGSLLGGCATYFTTANIIVSDLLVAHTPSLAPLGVLDFTPTGGLIAVAGIIFLAFAGRRLLPLRPPRPEQLMARRTGSELEEAYQLGDRLWEVKIPRSASFVGKTLGQAQIGDRLGLAVAAIWRGQQALFAPAANFELQSGDVLLTVGREERVSQLASQGLKIGRNGGEGHISERGVRFIELLLAPHSLAEGHTIRELEFRKKYGFTAVALLREGRSYRTDVANMTLKMGDSLLMVGTPARLKALQNEPNYIVLEPDLSDQPVNRHRAVAAVLIIVAAIAASIAGAPVYLAMLAAAVAVFLTGIVAPDAAYRAIEWPAIFLIAGMFVVSKAMVTTGLADLIGQQIVALVTPYGPLGLAAGAYLLTAGLTQLMGGQVAALVTGPITISAAVNLHTSPQAIAVATAIGCSASFLTPIAHPVNILMMGPGNYTFGDFFRIGWPLTIIAFLALLLGMVIFWGL